jgi:FdhE protein
MFLDRETEKRWLGLKADSLHGNGALPQDLLEVLLPVYSRQIEEGERIEAAHPEGSGLAGQTALPPLADELARSQGAPLLRREDFPVDHGAPGLFEEFLGLAEAAGGHLAEACRTIRQDLGQSRLVLAGPEGVFSALLRDADGLFRDYAGKTPQAPRALRFLAQASLMPGIEAAARALDSALAQDKPWNHGHCPICGSLPLMAGLKEKEGYRWLSCSFCRASYRYRRLRCAFCGNEEQKDLDFFTVAEVPGYRIDTCSTCKHYIKTVDFRQLDKISLPILDDLESLSLDILARQEGFTRPTLSGWGF